MESLKRKEDIDMQVLDLPGRYSCSEPLCSSAAGLGDVQHNGSGESTDDSRPIVLSSNTPPWTALTAGLPAALGSAGNCYETWTAGRRAEIFKREDSAPISLSKCWRQSFKDEYKCNKYRVRKPVFSAASSSLEMLRFFCIQCLPIRPYTYWDGNLILAETG